LRVCLFKKDTQNPSKRPTRVGLALTPRVGGCGRRAVRRRARLAAGAAQRPVSHWPRPGAARHCLHVVSRCMQYHHLLTAPVDAVFTADIGGSVCHGPYGTGGHRCVALTLVSVERCHGDAARITGRAQPHCTRACRYLHTSGAPCCELQLRRREARACTFAAPRRGHVRVRRRARARSGRRALLVGCAHSHRTRAARTRPLCGAGWLAVPLAVCLVPPRPRACRDGRLGGLLLTAVCGSADGARFRRWLTRMRVIPGRLAKVHARASRLRNCSSQQGAPLVCR